MESHSKVSLEVNTAQVLMELSTNTGSPEDPLLKKAHRFTLRRLIMARRLTASAFISGVDDETFGSNEYGEASLVRETVLSDSVPQNVLDMECRWGGECRVELTLVGQALDNGDVRVNGTAKLFEGTSEGTSDLDGQRDFVVLVPRGKNASDSVTVKNDDEGGDYADITVTFNNAIVED
jgi:hypothetical protein